MWKVPNCFFNMRIFLDKEKKISRLSGGLWNLSLNYDPLIMSLRSSRKAIDLFIRTTLYFRGFFHLVETKKVLKSLLCSCTVPKSLFGFSFLLFFSPSNEIAPHMLIASSPSSPLFMLTLHLFNWERTQTPTYTQR